MSMQYDLMKRHIACQAAVDSMALQVATADSGRETVVMDGCVRASLHRSCMMRVDKNCHNILHNEDHKGRGCTCRRLVLSRLSRIDGCLRSGTSFGGYRLMVGSPGSDGDVQALQGLYRGENAAIDGASPDCRRFVLMGMSFSLRGASEANIPLCRCDAVQAYRYEAVRGTRSVGNGGGILEMDGLVENRSLLPFDALWTMTFFLLFQIRRL